MPTMTGTTIPNVPPQFFDDNGAVANGYKLFAYAAGTTTKQYTYADAGLTSVNTNPILLDAAGRATIFLAPALSYKFVLATPLDSDPPGAPVWTRDNIYAIPYSSSNIDVTGTVGETVTLGQVVYLSDGTNGKTAGRWYLASSDNQYSSTQAGAVGFTLAAITSGNSGQIRVAGKVTDLPAHTTSPGSTYYAQTSPGDFGTTPPANALLLGIADSSTSMVLSQWSVQDNVNSTSDNGENLIKDGLFEIWDAGDSAAPTHWVKAGAGATISHNRSHQLGGNAVTLTSAAADASLSQTVLPSATFQNFERGKTFAVSAWGRCGTVTAWRVFITDGITTTYSLWNTDGASGQERLTATMQLNASTATTLQFGFIIKTGGFTVTVDGMRAVRGPLPPSLWKPSASARREINLGTIAGAVGTGTTKLGFRWSAPYPVVVLETRLVIGTAPTGQALACDVKKNGTSMYSTLPVIAPSATSGYGVPDSATYSTKCLTRGDVLTWDVTQVGNVVAGSDLTASIVYRTYLNAYDEWCGVTDVN